MVWSFIIFIISLFLWFGVSDLSLQYEFLVVLVDYLMYITIGLFVVLLIFIIIEIVKRCKKI